MGLVGLGINPNMTDLVLFSREYKIKNFRLPKLAGRELLLPTEIKHIHIMKNGLNFPYSR